MFEQDYLNHISLPAKLYDKIESDVADLSTQEVTKNEERDYV